MTVYSAPLREMRFVLAHIAGIADDDLVAEILEHAGRFAADVLAPLNQSGDASGCRLKDGVVTTPTGFREAYRGFVEGGWNGLGFDPALGGQGLPWPVATAVSEIWHAANPALGLCPLLTQAAVRLLSRQGSAEQKRRYLPNLVSGEWTATMCMTEPQAGSDLAAVRPSAVRDGEHYRVRGSKIFTSWGEHDLAENIVHTVLARTPEAPAGVKGLSLFVVPKWLPGEGGGLGARNEVRAVSLEHKLGLRASPTVVLAFGDGDGAVGEIVGRENDGMRLMFTMMNMARLGVGLEGVAIAERAYQQARAYARERRQGRRAGGESARLIDHADVRRMLLTMKSQTEAMRALAYFVAGRVGKTGAEALVDLLTPVVKGYCGEVCAEVASLGIQVHGGVGYIEETGAAQYLRDARVISIYEGTTGIQAQDLVRRKLDADGGAAARALPRRDAGPGCSPGRPSGHAPGPDRGARRARCGDRLWILRGLETDTQDAPAGASEYLRLFGLVTCGYLMSRAALGALAATDDRRFHDAKLSTARYFAARMLTGAQALQAALTSGADNVMTLPDEAF